MGNDNWHYQGHTGHDKRIIKYHSVPFLDVTILSLGVTIFSSGNYLGGRAFLSGSD